MSDNADLLGRMSHYQATASSQGYAAVASALADGIAEIRRLEAKVAELEKPLDDEALRVETAHAIKQRHGCSILEASDDADALLAAITPHIRAREQAAAQRMQERCAEVVYEKGIALNDAQCCGCPVGSPPECCAVPLYVLTSEDAAYAIRALTPETP